MITTEQKKKILAAMAQDRVRFDSDSKHAKVLGLATSVYSMVKQGQTDRTISDGNWIRLARRLGVSLRHEIEWKTGKTDTFIIVTKQLETAQSSALSMILCDEQNKKSNVGTISYIPALFGIGCASVAIRTLIGEMD